MKNRLEGEFFDDPHSRGRYSTDASIYQIDPLCVVVPKLVTDLEACIDFARGSGLSVLPRGGGTSQGGQTVGRSIVVDHSKYMNKVLSLDVENRRCVVQPGIVLDELNRALRPHGLWFPVDVSTASRATIGGMAGNNSCGARSLRYGIMRDNVQAIDAILANGQHLRFDVAGIDPSGQAADDLRSALLEIGRREANEIARRFPKLLRRVGGYNIDALVSDADPVNFAHLLVGSEGTLAHFTKIELKLSPLPGEKTVCICHFQTFRDAMEATQSIVSLSPQAVELIDDTMIRLARDIPIFRETVDHFVKGDPAALLLVEFDEGSPKRNQVKIDALADLIADLGYAFSSSGNRQGGVINVTDARLQNDIAELRRAGLNIMMSMKQDGKPVSFVEDCAVALADLADYTSGLTEIFGRNGTKGTWYAHASVGCLHVRPVLNIKQDVDVRKMRSIAEECFELVGSYKGSHSGEHGDGIVRSEFHERMFGARIVGAFGEVKKLFDPQNTFNPGKIVDPPRMDDRNLFRYKPEYTVKPFETQLDWSSWSGQGGGFQGAVEMCNNNGACRKLSGGVMCPSYRATGNERDVVRGRANTLRLAISGQLGESSLVSDEILEALSLCVSCKACKKECPMGVDVARMKIEVLAARREAYGLGIADNLVANLPKWAPWLANFPRLVNRADSVPGVGSLARRVLGVSKSRNLPQWSRNPFRDSEFDAADPDVILFADVFNRYFEPEVLRSAAMVLQAAGLKVRAAQPVDRKGNLDCGRTYLSAGCIPEARQEAKRLIDALAPFARNGVPIIGLEPASLLTFRDELPALLPGPDADQIAEVSMLFDEFFVRNKQTQNLALRALPNQILVHGHCHQKAHNLQSYAVKALSRIPDTRVDAIDSSCCGMAGFFGYSRETEIVSLKMAELSLFPAIRASNPGSIISANGFSCRQQISSGLGVKASHAATILAALVDTD